MSLQIPGDADTRYAPYVRSHFLDNDHQREAEDEGPSEPIPELGADLAVGPYSARIVVGRAGNESRAEHSDERPNSASRFRLLHSRH